MAQWVFKANGRVVPRQSLRPLTTAKIHSPAEEKKWNVFDALIERRMGTSINPSPTTDETTEDDLDTIMKPPQWMNWQNLTMRTYLTQQEGPLNNSQHLIRLSMLR